MKTHTKIILGVVGLLIAGFAVACTPIEEATEFTADEIAYLEALEEQGQTAAVPEPVEAEGCFLTGTCPFQNGWTAETWSIAYEAFLDSGLGDDVAACAADATMLRMTVDEVVALSDAEAEQVGQSIALNECLPLLID
ncbi:hypothetical protein LCGC14_0294540 [marine sediment metagenome]|uniref:Uncharacterized protein n=1 Tax=marine sediment metagenome TaxID=412755 RepID=A0A0F9WDA4_9ZZZZ